MNDTPNDLFIRTILQSDIYCYPVLALWSSCFLKQFQKRRANRNFLAKMSTKHMMQTSVVVGLLCLSHLPFIVPKKRRLNRLFSPRCRPNINFLLPGLTWPSFPGNKPILQSDIYCYPVLALWSSCFLKLKVSPHGKQLGSSVSCGYLSASFCQSSIVPKKACQSKFPRQDVDQTHDANLGCCRAGVPLPFAFFVPKEVEQPYNNRGQQHVHQTIYLWIIK
jgi:hypothetical protein